MKYTTRGGNGHPFVGILPKALSGTAKIRVWKITGGTSAPVEITSTHLTTDFGTNHDEAVAISGVPNGYSFDLKHAMGGNLGDVAGNHYDGTTNGQFPTYEEHGVLVMFYDDSDVSIMDISKQVLGGSEDQIHEITGVDHRNLSNIWDAVNGGNIYECRAGYEYIDTDNQTTDTITFRPFLQKGGQTILADGNATIKVCNIDSTSALLGGILTDTAADSNGVFTVSKVDTSSLTPNTTYTLIVSITHDSVTYTSTHQFLFASNEEA